MGLHKITTKIEKYAKIEQKNNRTNTELIDRENWILELLLCKKNIKYDISCSSLVAFIFK